MIPFALLPLLLAAPRVSVTPPEVVPGGIVMVDVHGVDDPASLSGHLFGLSLHFFTAGEHHQRAYAGVALDADAQTYDVDILWKGPRRRTLSTQGEIIEKEFNQSELKVSKRFLAPTAADKLHIKQDKEIKKAYRGVVFGPALFHGKLSLPKKNPEITAHFGDQRIFNGQVQSKHEGTDFDGNIGDPILAAAEGQGDPGPRVLHEREHGDPGPGRGVFTSYFHMSRMDVKPGDRVGRGQQLGLVGKTGRVTGPHLHFGVKVGARQVDAEEAFKTRAGSGPGLGFSGSPSCPPMRAQRQTGDSPMPGRRRRSLGRRAGHSPGAEGPSSTGAPRLGTPASLGAWIPSATPPTAIVPRPPRVASSKPSPWVGQASTSPLWALGPARWGRSSSPRPRRNRIINGALDRGVRVFDTARSYGLAEERLARHLGRRRDEAVLVTKGGYGVEGIPDWTGTAVSLGIDRALRTLKTDRIDVFLLHSCAELVLGDDAVLGAGRGQSGGKGPLGRVLGRQPRAGGRRGDRALRGLRVLFESGRSSRTGPPSRPSGRAAAGSSPSGRWGTPPGVSSDRRLPTRPSTGSGIRLWA